MHVASYPSPSNPQISLPRLSILGQPPVVAPVPKAPRNRGAQLARPAGPAPACIMVGLDDSGKPHASVFRADDADAAANAADLMDMAIIEIGNDATLSQVATRLPLGKLFESGKAFVPFVKRSTYELLAVHLSGEYQAAAAKRIEAASNAEYAKASKGEVAPRNHPEHWSKIAVGDVVLASEGHDDGWWEATVVAEENGDSFLLRWTDWPELDQFVRHVTDIALLHPKHFGA